MSQEGHQFRSATAFATAAAGDLEAAEYHRAGDEQDDDGDHGAGQVPHAARPVQRVHPVGPGEGKDRFSNRGCQWSSQFDRSTGPEKWWTLGCENFLYSLICLA